MKRTLLVPALAMASIAWTTAAHAQSNGWIVSRPSYAVERQSYSDARRAAYDNGYREGLKLGERDGRRGAAFAYQNERTYQRADRGYHRSHGDRERYRQSFRSGYAAGYSDAYRRYAPAYRTQAPRGGGVYGGYPGRYGSYAPAFQNGVKDGYEKGIEDARKRRSFDVLRHKWYRDATRRYDRQYGSREQYRNVYRQGFREGYQRGYQEGRYFR